MHERMAQAERERRLLDLEEKLKRGEYTGEPDPAPEPVVVDPFGRAVDLYAHGYGMPSALGHASSFPSASAIAWHAHYRRHADGFPS